MNVSTTESVAAETRPELDCFSDLSIVFVPVWDTERQKFPIRMGQTRFTRVDPWPLAEAGEALEGLDFGTLYAFAGSLAGYETLERPALVSLPIHFETLAQPQPRLRYALQLAALPAHVRQRLVVEIIELPKETHGMQLAACQEPLAGRCLNTSASVPLSFRDFDLLKRNHFLIVGTDLGNTDQRAPGIYEAVKAFAIAAQRAGIVPALTGLKEPRLARHASDYFRYIAGPAVADAQATLSPRVDLKL